MSLVILYADNRYSLRFVTIRIQRLHSRKTSLFENEIFFRSLFFPPRKIDLIDTVKRKQIENNNSRDRNNYVFLSVNKLTRIIINCSVKLHINYLSFKTRINMRVKKRMFFIVFPQRNNVKYLTKKLIINIYLYQYIIVLTLLILIKRRYQDHYRDKNLE